MLDGSTNKLLMVDGIHYDEEMEFLVVRLSSCHKVKLAKGAKYTLSMNLTDRVDK